MGACCQPVKGQLAKTQNAETVARWAEALDALDSVLPFDRRGFLAELLTDDDVSIRASMVLMAFARRCALSLAKAISIGLRSGL